jgi:endoglycosylceramidase
VIAALALLLACAAEDDVLPTCALDAPEAGPLRAEGRLLLDEQGRRVTLRGVNAGGRSKFAPYSPFDYSDDFDAALEVYLDRAAGWRIDVLRVPFSWEGFEPSRGQPDEDALARYDALLDGAYARGLWTIVDFHQDVYASPFCGDGFPPWTLDDPGEPHWDCHDWYNGYFFDDEVQAAFDRFWADAPAGDATEGVRTAFGQLWDGVVDRHADRPGVIGYEVLNEPSWGNADSEVWAADTLAPFYEELAARLQARDPGALIFFDATGYDAVTTSTDMPRPAGDNLVFAPHFYDPTLVVGDGPTVADVDERLGDWAAVGAAWDLPVLIGEFGLQPHREGVTEFIREHYEAFDALGLHATCWEYSASEALWNYEDLSLVEPDGAPRSSLLDAAVRPYVRALAGELEALTYDHESGALTLRYSGEVGGVSEIALPAALYPADVELRGAGACVDRQGDWLLIEAEEGEVEVRVGGS